MAIETQAEVKQNTLLTAEDLWRMHDDECRHELVKGEISTMPPAGGEHGSVASNLHRLLGQFVWSNKLGVTPIADAGYILSHDPDTVRAPDLSFVARERIPANGMPVGYWPIAPDLAVEVISPSEGVNDIQTKVIAYLSAGTRMMWLVFPRTRTVTVYRSLQNARILTANDTLSGEEVVPGFTCQVAELFV
jgi:Uma2 family endonuclease